MRQYYIYDGQSKKGPFNTEELKSQALTKETPVWYEGLQNWALARDVTELNELFSKNGASAPPPVPAEFKKTTDKSKSEILESFEDAQEIFIEKKKNRFLLPLIIILVVAGVLAALFFYAR